MDIPSPLSSASGRHWHQHDVVAQEPSSTLQGRVGFLSLGQGGKSIVLSKHLQSLIGGAEGNRTRSLLLSQGVQGRLITPLISFIIVPNSFIRLTIGA